MYAVFWSGFWGIMNLVFILLEKFKYWVAFNLLTLGRRTRLLIVASLFLCSFLGVVFLAWTRGYFDPYVAAENITLSNVTDKSVTISWKTVKPARGRVVVSNKGFYPWDQKIRVRKDDLLELADMNTQLDTHHITVSGLLADHTYGVKVYNGWWSSKTYKFTTRPEIQNLPNPHPSYGRIVDSERKKGIPGVLVYMVISREGHTATLSTIADSQGKWAIDVANIRDIQGQSFDLSDPRVGIEILVEGGRRGRVKATLNSKQLSPAPDIVFRVTKEGT